MKTLKELLTAALLFSLVLGQTPVFGAEKRNLYVYGDLDPQVSALLVKGFSALYPDINVDFINMSSSDVFSKHMNDIAGRKVTADILWLREPNLLAGLVKGGYFLRQNPGADGAILPGADFSGAVFAVALDPVVMVYNRERLQQKEPPSTRAALVRLLQDKNYSGGIGTCDPEKSDRALLLLTQDSVHGRDFRAMARSFGAAAVKQYADYGALLDSVEKGEVAMGYNIPLSEVMKRPSFTKTAAWFYMNDYTLVLPHAVMSAKGATNGAEARLWIEFARSARGQEIISKGLALYPVRTDLTPSSMSHKGGALPAGKSLKIIAAGEEVARFNPAGVRKGFLLRWRQLLKLEK